MTMYMGRTIRKRYWKAIPPLHFTDDMVIGRERNRVTINISKLLPDAIFGDRITINAGAERATMENFFSKNVQLWKAFNNTVVNTTDNGYCGFCMRSGQTAPGFAVLDIYSVSFRFTYISVATRPNDNFRADLIAGYRNIYNGEWLQAGKTVTSNTGATNYVLYDGSQIETDFMFFEFQNSDGYFGVQNIQIKGYYETNGNVYDYVEEIPENCLVYGEKNKMYTKREYKTPGTYSLTIPDNINELTVTGCGGGAGGLTFGSYNENKTLTATAGNGGDSKVGTFIIPGGKGGTGILTNGTPTVKQAAVSSPNGIVGETKVCYNVDFVLHGKGFRYGESIQSGMADIMNNVGYYARSSNNLNDTYYASTGSGSVEAYGYYGAGGGTYHFYDTDGISHQVGIAGNTGAFVVKQKIAVTPGSTIDIVVGAGGKHAFYSNDGDGARRFRVTDGTHGFIIVEYGDSFTQWETYFPVLNN